MRNVIFIVLSLVYSSCSTAKPPSVPITQLTTLKHEVLVKNLDGVPWGMTFLSENELLITLREGVMKKLDLTTKTLTPIQGVPKVFAEVQGGLLDIAVAKNGFLYFTYSYEEKDKQATRLARAKLKGDRLVDFEVLFTTSPFIDSGYHFGSRLAFDQEGHLYMSVGERNQRELAQKLDNHYGKVLRLTLDGKPVKGNPFENQKDAKPEIWSYGHRNPQGLVFDQAKKELWVHEHGPRGGDEINLVKKGANYAWPLATYGREYWGPKVSEHETYAGTENPRHVWLPSIAPSDMLIYQGQAIKGWQGSFVIGSLTLEHLNRVVMKDGQSIKEERFLVELEERIRSVEEDSQGRILVGTDNGMLLRLEEKR